MLANFQRKVAEGLLKPRIDLSEPTDDPRGLEIHSRNARFSLRMALGDVFPVTKRLVGDVFFGAMADHFVTEQPPKHGWLSAFGEGFPEFVAVYPPASEVIYLADVAKIEWAKVRAANAPAAPGLDLESLSKITPEAIENLHLRLHGAASLVCSSFPIFDIWQAHHHSADDHLPNIDLVKGAQSVFVSRPGTLEVGIALLSPGDAALLNMLEGHSSFTCSCQAAFLAEPDYDLGAKLVHLVSLRAFASLAD